MKEEVETDARKKCLESLDLSSRKSTGHPIVVGAMRNTGKNRERDRLPTRMRQLSEEKTEHPRSRKIRKEPDCLRG